MNAVVHVVACGVLLVGLAGCSAFRGGDKVVKFHPGEGSAGKVATRGGTYVVAYRDKGSGEMWQADRGKVKVRKGESVGFKEDQEGRVIAFAGGRSREIGPIPVTANYVCWYRLSDTTMRARKFGDDLRDGALATGEVAVVGAAFVGAAAVGSVLEDCDEEGGSWWDDDLMRRRNLEPRRDGDNRSQHRRHSD